MTPVEAAAIAAIKAHAEKHRKAGRATFSIPSILELLASLEAAEELADKYKWQVRDTCTRAEKAEAALAAAEKAEVERINKGWEESRASAADAGLALRELEARADKLKAACG